MKYLLRPPVVYAWEAHQKSSWPQGWRMFVNWDAEKGSYIDDLRRGAEEELMKKGKRMDVPKERLEEAQTVIEVAASGGEFNAFAEVDNCAAGHAKLRERALGLLADAYPDCDVEVVAFPNSEYVDLQVVPKLLEPEAEKPAATP